MQIHSPCDCHCRLAGWWVDPNAVSMQQDWAYAHSRWRDKRHIHAPSVWSNEHDPLPANQLEDSWNARKISVISGYPLAGYIPVIVVDYRNISCSQIDTKSSSTSCEQENEFLAVGFIILVYCGDTVIVSGPSINTAVFCGCQVKPQKRRRWKTKKTCCIVETNNNLPRYPIYGSSG